MDMKKTTQTEKEYQPMINQALTTLARMNQLEDIDIKYHYDYESQANCIDKTVWADNLPIWTVDDKAHDSFNYGRYNCFIFEFGRDYKTRKSLNIDIEFEGKSLAYGWAIKPNSEAELLAIPTKYKDVYILNKEAVKNDIWDNFNEYIERYGYKTKETYRYGKYHYTGYSMYIPIKDCIPWIGSLHISSREKAPGRWETLTYILDKLRRRYTVS